MWTGLLAVFATFELPFPNPMPTNDISLFHRALYQDCQDMNNDTLAYDFLEGPQKLLLSNKLGRDFVRTVTSTLSDGNSVYWSARTNYIDSKIASWLAADPSIEQVVLVASGFDSRPYRLQAPPLTLLPPPPPPTHPQPTPIPPLPPPTPPYPPLPRIRLRLSALPPPSAPR